MTGRGVTESHIEQAALAWLETSGGTVRNNAKVAMGEPKASGATAARTSMCRNE